MITFENISKQYGSTTLFEAASWGFNEKERTSLIGVNGSGKTTILRMLAGIEFPDRGSIVKPSGITIEYLPQEIESFDDKTPLQIVLESYSHLVNFEETLGELAAEGDDPDDIREAMRKLDALNEQMEFHDGYSLKARAEAILGGLGIPHTKWSRPVQELSGGYRMRAVLGRLLLKEPDFLLLDEPTNHLDMDSLVWLEKFLLRYKGGMLIVSHDRDFLNRITTATAEITGRTLAICKGNYDAYMKFREEALANALSRTRNLEIQIAHAERFVERFKAKNTKATQAQSRMKQIELLKAELPQITAKSKEIRFSLPLPMQSGAVPLKLDNIEVRYGDSTVFSNLSLSVSRGEKIAIVGPNGAGKSTLLKVLAGLVSPVRGTAQTGYNAMVRYFGQHQLEQLDPEKTVYDTVAVESVNTEKTFIRSLLGLFLFSGDAIDKKVKVLSGGEKSRLVLSTIMASPGNTLLLDEPTNHLDINSIEVLAGAMADYKGTVVFVSHDDFLISRIATRIVEIRPGVLRDFPGTLKDYRSYIESGFEYDGTRLTAESGHGENPKVIEKQARIQEREEKKKLTRAIEKVEREIAAREEAIRRLRETLNDPAHGTSHELLHSATAQLETENGALDRCFTEWESLHEALEQTGGARDDP